MDRRDGCARARATVAANRRESPRPRRPERARPATDALRRARGRDRDAGCAPEPATTKRKNPIMKGPMGALDFFFCARRTPVDESRGDVYSLSERGRRERTLSLPSVTTPRLLMLVAWRSLRSL